MKFNISEQIKQISIYLLFLIVQYIKKKYKFSIRKIRRSVNFPDKFLFFLKKNITFKNIIILIRRNSIFLDQYKIEGTNNLNQDPCFKNPKTYYNFQIELKKFKEYLIKLVKNDNCKTIFKFGDGDYYFLKKMPVGSAKPGKRALSKSYSEINHNSFVKGVLKNDYIAVELYPRNRNKFYELYPKRKIDFPAEFLYGLVANKWFFKTFKGKIGLIGAKEKLLLIKKLLEFKEYREYLGIDEFNDYIEIPQKFACDDVYKLENEISNKLSDTNSKIFLLGIGHVKSALLFKLKKYKKAIYIDVGSGIDAIAGIINNKRPYMGNWVNYRLLNFNYSSIDDLNYLSSGKEIFLKNKNA